MDQTAHSDPSPSPPAGPPAGGSREGVAVPAPTFHAMAGGLRRAGASGRAALREAGRTAGDALFVSMAEGSGVSPGEFWEEARRRAVSAGLGRPEYAVLAPGVGSIVLSGGPEASGRDSGACHFAAGWIGGLLSRAAGEPVAVLEVRCAGLGPGGACRFLVGSEARLREIRRRLADGEPLSRALSGEGRGEGDTRAERGGEAASEADRMERSGQAGREGDGEAGRP